MAEDDAPSNLKQLFSKGLIQFHQVEAANYSDPTYQENLQSAINTFAKCRKIAIDISLFSPNEHLDDISSANLQYLLIDHYLAELLLKRSAPDRKAILAQVQDAYERFLRLLDAYDILSQSDRQLFDHYLEDRTNFLITPTSDPATRRSTKIARLNVERDLRTKLQFLEQNPHALENDETVLRELRVTELKLRASKVFSQLDMITQELQILAMAPPSPPSFSETMEDDRRRRQGDVKDGYSERLDPPISQLLNRGKTGAILDKDGRPLQPFTIVDHRAQLRKGVFRPGHNLPTMTIDEYLEEERRRGGIIEGGGEESVEEVDEDDMDKADAATMKARAWDQFTEEHPKGSGNTLNRG